MATCNVCGGPCKDGWNFCDRCFYTPGFSATVEAKGLCVRCIEPRNGEKAPFCASCWQQCRDDEQVEKESTDRRKNRDKGYGH